MLNLKPVRPSLREKKRYIVYELEFFNKEDATKKVSKNMFEIQNSLINEINKLLGVFDSAKAGLQSIKTSNEKFRGIIKVNHLYVDKIKASFVLIKELNGLNIRISSIGVSGILKKAKENYFE